MNKRLTKARAEHDLWLEKRGLLPSQIRARRGKPKPLSTWNAQRPPAPRQSMTYTAGVNSIWEKIRKGEEKPETIEAIVAKSKRIAPAYSKGAYQLITPGMEIENLGKKK